MPMPVQKPGNSKQDYQTPPELILAVKKRLGISDFVLDLAACKDNAVCETYYSLEEGIDSLIHPWNVPANPGWAWCNPPYADIKPWVEKASLEAAQGALIVMLVPASVGANWWINYVVPFAYQTFLNGRVTFQGCVTPYPKDCALLLYTPWRFRGIQFWDWRE